MEFTLVYRGELKANAGPNEKMEIRRKFHPQLKKLWGFPPLKTLNNKKILNDSPSNKEITIIQNVKDFRFAPFS